MTLRQYFIWMIVATALCWLGWLSVIWMIDPAEAGLLGFFLFYAALCLALIGTFSVAGLGFRALARRQEPVSRHAATSFRQGVLLTVLMAGSLAMQSRSLLTWWNLMLFIITVTVLEFFLISFRSRR
ncbi:MAG: hypothetical protein AAB554_01325 [Patescibacteria group bacterium]